MSIEEATQSLRLIYNWTDSTPNLRGNSVVEANKGISNVFFTNNRQRSRIYDSNKAEIGGILKGKYTPIYNNNKAEFGSILEGEYTPKI